MTQIIERLELPTETFRALEQIAQVDGSPLSVVVNQLVKEKLTKQLRSLRREYQRLVGKELTHSLSREEKARLRSSLSISTQSNSSQKQGAMPIVVSMKLTRA